MCERPHIQIPSDDVSSQQALPLAFHFVEISYWLLVTLFFKNSESLTACIQAKCLGLAQLWKHTVQLAAETASLSSFVSVK